MTKSSEIKNAIKTLLDELLFVKDENNNITSGCLGEVVEEDFAISVFDRQFGEYPAAILSSPSIEGIAYDNSRNLRTYSFEVGVIIKAENITGPTDVEEIMETIIDKFDKHPTLNGTSDGGVEPSISMPAATTSRSKTYIYFSINIKAKAIATIN